MRGCRIGSLMVLVGAAQAAIAASLYVASVVSPQAPARPNVMAVLVYDPPPPPPPPLPKGSPLRPQPVRPEPPTSVVERPSSHPLTIPVPQPLTDLTIAPEAGVRPADRFGSLAGVDLGDVLGTEDGVPGGVAGGTEGGVPGGVIGGTGTGPVRDYDAEPRPIRQTKPTYPEEAFIRKVEGTVLIEILIDASGHVRPTRVLQSIPLLDDAARATVAQWLFQPAVKHGRPVATIAHAPVRFTLY
jgi:protein TonB